MAKTRNACRPGARSRRAVSGRVGRAPIELAAEADRGLAGGEGKGDLAPAGGGEQKLGWPTKDAGFRRRLSLGGGGGVAEAEAADRPAARRLPVPVPGSDRAACRAGGSCWGYALRSTRIRPAGIPVLRVVDQGGVEARSAIDGQVLVTGVGEDRVVARLGEVGVVAGAAQQLVVGRIADERCRRRPEPSTSSIATRPVSSAGAGALRLALRPDSAQPRWRPCRS